MTPSSKSSRSRYSSSVRPGATPARASRALKPRLGALAQLVDLVERAAAVADGKARQDRLCVRGRKAQRSAISTVEASASGRSAKALSHFGARS